MKKKKSSISLISAMGIAAVIGILFAFADRITVAVNFEMIWINYTLLAILFIMAIQISSLWLQSKKQDYPNSDIDKLAFIREKIAYKFIGVTSLFLIITCTNFLSILLDNFSQVVEMDEITKSTFILLITTIGLFFYGFIAQMKAVKFHNKHNPDSLLDMNRTDGYKKYFDNLDEGEKFEAYRVSYKSFYQMNFIFPLALLILFLISIVFSPQLFAIGIVGALWFVMYLIYYQEGVKQYK